MMDRKRKKSSPESGAFLVLFSVILIMFIGLSIYVIGTGFLTNNKTHLTNIANVVALGALEEFTEASGSIEERAVSAKERADTLLASNSLLGLHSDLGGLQFSDSLESCESKGGCLVFGQWVTEAPRDNNGIHCANETYPCFHRNDTGPEAGGTESVNAVKVKVCNQKSDNPMILPFLPEGGRFICSEAMATTLKRCVGFLVDASYSTTYDTHLSAPYTYGSEQGIDWYPNSTAARRGLRVMHPRERDADSYNPDFASNTRNLSKAALPFYEVEAVLTDDECTRPTKFDASSPYSIQSAFWCSMPLTRPNDYNTGPLIHYRSDYVRRVGKSGREYYVDSFTEGSGGEYTGPRPMVDIFSAINTGLRKMEEVRTAGDMAMLMVFNKNIIDRVPASGLTSDLGFMIQLTNFDNIGVSSHPDISTPSQISPNFLDRGWFPYGDPTDSEGNPSTKTNIPLALDVAIDSMNRQCPANSDKSIVLFTDGMSNCARAWDAWDASSAFQSAFDTRNVGDRGWYKCGTDSGNDQWVFSANALRDLIGDLSSNVDKVRYSTGATGDNAETVLPTILKSLQDSGIRLTTVLAGSGAAPHTVHRDNGSGRLSYEDAVALGYGRAHEASSLNRLSSFVLVYPEITPAPASPYNYTLQNLGLPGFVFSQQGPVFSGLSNDTGGIFCPIRPKCQVRGSLTDPEHMFERPPCPSGCGVHVNLRGGDSTYGDCYEDATDGGPRRLKAAAFENCNNGAPEDSFCADWQDTRNNCSQEALFCSPLDLTVAEQARKCVADTVAGNPYVLAAEPERAATP